MTKNSLFRNRTDREGVLKMPADTISRTSVYYALKLDKDVQAEVVLVNIGLPRTVDEAAKVLEAAACAWPEPAAKL